MASKISLKHDAKLALEAYDKMQSYCIQENLLKHLVEEFPDHANRDAVEVKVKMLNLFYSTGIQATNAMVNNIMNINRIDQRLKEGDYTLINEIATLSLKKCVRFNYSFATKYCAYHQPDLYPIYDRIVADTLVSLFEKGLLPNYKPIVNNTMLSTSHTKRTFAQYLKNYRFFVEVYRHFIEQFDLQSYTYRQVDAYIWGAFKIGGQEFEIEKLAQLDKTKIVEYYISPQKKK